MKRDTKGKIMEEKNKLSESQVNQITDMLKKQNDKEFEEMSRPIKRIYVDIEFLQDFRLGSLIKLITTDVEYQYILSELPKYSMSHGEPITSFFPELGFKEEQIREYMKDKSHWETLALTSPYYETIKDLCSLIIEITKHNVLMHYSKPIELYIGCTDLLYCIEARRRLAVLLLDYLDKIDLTFLPTSLYEFKEVAIDDYDIYMLASANKFINNESLVKKFENMEMTGKTIIGLEEMDTTDEELKEANFSKEDALEATVEFANMFTRFGFAKRVILV